MGAPTGAEGPATVMGRGTSSPRRHLDGRSQSAGRGPNLSAICVRRLGFSLVCGKFAAMPGLRCQRTVERLVGKPDPAYCSAWRLGKASLGIVGQPNSLVRALPWRYGGRSLRRPYRRRQASPQEKRARFGSVIPALLMALDPWPLQTDHLLGPNHENSRCPARPHYRCTRRSAGAVESWRSDKLACRVIGAQMGGCGRTNEHSSRIRVRAASFSHHRRLQAIED